MKQQEKNNFPLYFEELKVNQEEKINNKENLTQFKQFIPANFISIALQAGNYCGSTNSKWKNKPLCERYGFDYQVNWIQIDIPHDLMEKLELEKGKDINQPFYLGPQVLERNPSYGGITIENETEIILINPNKITMKEAGTQTELSSGELNQQVEGLRTERDNLKEKHNQLRINISNILYPKIEGATLAENDRELINQVEMIIRKLGDLETEMEKEKGWWDKWMNDNNDKEMLGGGINASGVRSNNWYNENLKYVIKKEERVAFTITNFCDIMHYIVYKFGENGNFYERIENCNVRKGKEIIKRLYEYYKNK